MIRMVISMIIIRVMIRMMRVMSIYLMTEQESIIASTGMLKPVVLQDDNEIISNVFMGHMGHMVMIMISITMAMTMMTMTTTTTRR